MCNEVQGQVNIHDLQKRKNINTGESYGVVKEVQQDATIAFLFSAMALLYTFRATISPIIRNTYAVYGHR